MAPGSGLASQWIRTSVFGLLLLASQSTADGLATSYCSPDLTAGDFTPVFNTWQTNGACRDACVNAGTYAFAVIKNQNCWCSNYIPAAQVSTYDCNGVCPGFGTEWCGSEEKGLYAYFALAGNAPSGTAGGSSPTSGSPSPSSTRLSSSSATRVSTPTEVYTSITTVTGQIRTVLITPTPTSDSTLGSGTTINSSGSSGGVSTGKVVGIVIGVALGLGTIIGIGVWLWLRRRHQRNLEAVSLDSASAHGNTGIPSRQVSQMSSAGLLGKTPRIMTAGLPSSNNPRSADTLGSNHDRRSLATDQRLNPYAIYAHDESRHSNVSLQDNQDYSRQLRIANPDP